MIDVGLPAEEVRALVRVGDPVTIRQSTMALKNGCVAGKAMDNRASVAALTLALEALRHREHAWDFYAVATVQEEVGVKGAITSAYGISPTIAVALDVTFARQYNDSNPGVFELGKGPTIGVGPNFHPQMVKRLAEAAESDEIPIELEPLPGSSGTDAWGIQVAREGIPSGLISIPVRYMHQPVETVALVDIERAGRLLAGFVCGLEHGYTPRWEDEV
jgi:endoglucanase